MQSGHTRFPGRRPLPVDTIFDRDTPVLLQNGIKIFVDVFRPVVTANDQKVPAILVWSPYGKTGTGVQQYDTIAPHRAGLDLDRTLGYEKFEGPDPAEWVQRGYAVVNADAPGCNDSEESIQFWGPDEVASVHDTIDWISKQPWSNEAVGMAGNSWLAIAQINYASRLRHPALKALAPWEIFTDVYRDFVFRGGMTQNSAFMNLLIKTFAGNSVANMPAMAQHRPLYDDYWNTKYIMTENISVPLYILASFSSMIHTRGSFQVCRTADTKQKWLRVHPYQEWYDLYRPEAVDDLQAFYDRFLKGAHNGWEQRTPPVRLSILGFEATGGESKTVIERPEQEFPLSRQTLKIFYLDAASKTLKTESTPTATWAEHPAHDLVASSVSIRLADAS